MLEREAVIVSANSDVFLKQHGRQKCCQWLKVLEMEFPVAVTEFPVALIELPVAVMDDDDDDGDDGEYYCGDSYCSSG